MNLAEQSAVRSPLGRWRALLVLGLLTGLLGMHALAPTGGTGHAERAHGVHMTAEATAVDDCPGDGHCGGHHLKHADATCASGAVSGGPALPVLVPDPVAAPVRADSMRSRAAAAPDGARAPPSLAELQLLRI
ncbi:DUF6153 family protein [Streptomyces sp. HUAS TT20]|uniref:DUF6153 family protein n=1 Tax=Streptomyces sp. HUAS TT20 TaxID=3447509 RepID=UPI0021DA8614|nr:DUF6153 family protein [Streptomyces sp. HUAS 15-9]UXY26158.1 DUF6153 family protein [Streptomyces sp. HUAS 15-9]